MCTTQVCTVASGQVDPDRLRQPLQAVAADDQRVLEAAVSELGQHRRPLLRALTARRAQPEAEHVALAVEVDADRDVDRPVRDLRAPDLDHQAVDQQHRVERIERPALPGDHLLDDLVGDLRDRLPRHLRPVDLEQVLLDVARRQALRVQRDHVARKPVQAPLVLRHRHRLERALPVPRDPQLDLADLGRRPSCRRRRCGRCPTPTRPARAARSRDARPSRPRARSATHAASDPSAGRPRRSAPHRPREPERPAAQPTPAPIRRQHRHQLAARALAAPIKTLRHHSAPSPATLSQRVRPHLLTQSFGQTLGYWKLFVGFEGGR